MLIAVVGVKLDIGVWMTSFINTTQRANVSRSQGANIQAVLCREALSVHRATILPPGVSRLD